MPSCGARGAFTASQHRILEPTHAPDHIEHFDALDTDIRRNPWPYYQWLQAAPERRIYKLPFEQNFYLVHHHEDVARVLMDPDAFSGQIFHDREIPFFPMMHGAEHRRIRGVVQELFTPRATRSLQPGIEAASLHHTRILLAAGRGDLMDLWATRIPLHVISTMVGLPEDADSLTRLRRQAVALNTEAFPLGGTGERDPRRASGLQRLRGAFGFAALLPRVLVLLNTIGWAGAREISRYIAGSDLPPDAPRQSVSHGDPAARLGEILALLVQLGKLLRTHIANPGSDRIVARFVARHLAGEVSLVEMIMACLIIILAGYGTTSNLLACGVHRLATTPGLLDDLRTRPDDIETFVEELLRFYGPLQRTQRRVTRDIELGGTMLPKNTQLIVVLGAANMDAQRFKSPCHFDPRRADAAQHIAFGKGTHICLGAALARLEVRIGLDALIQRARSITLDPEGTVDHIVNRDTGMFGFECLPVIIQAL